MAQSNTSRPRLGLLLLALVLFAGGLLHAASGGGPPVSLFGLFAATVGLVVIGLAQAAPKRDQTQ